MRPLILLLRELSVKKRSRIAIYSAILLTSSVILFTATTQRASAFIFTDPFETVIVESLETMETLIVSLSNDIGTMADRILLMADNIGIMADRIGDMSDRIVHTEELLVSIATENNASSLILSPVEGTQVYSTTPIQISLSTEKLEYLLYISNNADMSGATNALVQMETHPQHGVVLQTLHLEKKFILLFRLLELQVIANYQIQ